MKRRYFSFVLLLISFLAQSQLGTKDQVIYLDSLKRLGDIKNYNYFRIIKDFQLERDSYEVLVYYKSGKIEMRGTTKDKNNLKLNGSCIYYYENGNRKKLATYFNNNLNGKQFEWYENGAIKSETEVTFDKKKKTEITRVLQYWDENNSQKVINGEGEYVEEDLDTKTISKGPIKNYLKEGEWKGNSEYFKYSFVEYYKKGTISNGVSTDSLQNKHEYYQIQTNPVPKKGMSDLYRFIDDNMKLPDKTDKTFKGTLFVSLILRKDGKIEEIKTSIKDDFGLSENLKATILKYNEWIPTAIRGISVDYGISFPVKVSGFR